MRDPILVTLLKYSQSSRENVTPSSGTSPLASHKEVPPPPLHPPPGLKYKAVLQLKSTLKFLTYLDSLINVITFCLQLIVLFFYSGVIQLTLRAHTRLLKVETSAVGFKKAMYLTGFRVKGVNAANHVMFQTFTFKDVVGSPFQVTTGVWKEGFRQQWK